MVPSGRDSVRASSSAALSIVTPWRREWVRSSAYRRRSSATRPLIGVLGEALALRVVEYIGEEHLGIVAPRLEQHHVGVGKIMAVTAHAGPHAGIKTMARNVCDSTVGSPPSTKEMRRPCVCRAAASALNGTSGLMHSRSFVPSRKATRGMQRLDQRAVDIMVPPISTGGNRPGSAALASTARAIGTSSQPGAPNGTASAESRSVATRNSLRRNLRKSLVRPGAENRPVRYSPILELSKIPVGKACASCQYD